MAHHSAWSSERRRRFYFTSVNAAHLRALAGQNRAFVVHPDRQVPPAGKMTESASTCPMANGRRPGRAFVSDPSGTEPAARGGLRAPRQGGAVLPSSSRLICGGPRRAKREFWVVFKTISRIIKEQLPQMMDRASSCGMVLAEAFAAKRYRGVRTTAVLLARQRTAPGQSGQTIAARRTEHVLQRHPGHRHRRSRDAAALGILTKRPGPDGRHPGYRRGRGVGSGPG